MFTLKKRLQLRLNQFVFDTLHSLVVMHFFCTAPRLINNWGHLFISLYQCASIFVSIRDTQSLVCFMLLWISNCWTMSEYWLPFSSSWQRVFGVLRLLPVYFTWSSSCCLEVTDTYRPGVSLSIFQSSVFRVYCRPLCPCSYSYNRLGIPVSLQSSFSTPGSIGGVLC